MILFSGPYAWVKYTPGEPILPNNPNEGSVKRRNEKKRMRLRREFILVRCFAKKKKLVEKFLYFICFGGTSFDVSTRICFNC